MARLREATADDLARAMEGYRKRSYGRSSNRPVQMVPTPAQTQPPSQWSDPSWSNTQNEELPIPELSEASTSPTMSAVSEAPTPSDLPALIDITNRAETLAVSTSGLELIVGTAAPTSQAFCPIVAISKFPYKFMLNNKKLGQSVSECYFAEAKFWNRRWTIYYIYPLWDAGKPLLLVPAEEVETFFSIVNKKYNNALNLSKVRDQAICTTFRFKHPRLRPRFLGISHSQDQYQKLQITMPEEHYRPRGQKDDTPLDHDSTEAKNCNLIILQGLDLGGGSKKKGPGRHAAPEVKEQYRAVAAGQWESLLKQVERFLGLRVAHYQAPVKKAADPNDWSSWATDAQPSWEETQAEILAKADHYKDATVYEDEPAPFSFDSNVVLISIDVEAWERDNSKVTEIGICTLDTNDLAGIAPGVNAKNWYENIKAHHLRIRDHIHLRNGEFVADSADSFRFGASEIIPLSTTPQTLGELFRQQDATGAYRTIVLVGHDVTHDFRYLRQVGYDVSNLQARLHKAHPKLDTQALHKAFKRRAAAATANPATPAKPAANPQNVGLATILDELDITPFGLHNAGNDAVYTLQALLGMAVNGAVVKTKAITSNNASETSKDAWNGDVSQWKTKEQQSKEEDWGNAHAKWRMKDDLDWKSSGAAPMAEEFEYE